MTSTEDQRLDGALVRKFIESLGLDPRQVMFMSIDAVNGVTVSLRRVRSEVTPAVVEFVEACGLDPNTVSFMSVDTDRVVATRWKRSPDGRAMVDPETRAPVIEQVGFRIE